MIGIYDCFGYGPGYDVPFEERYRLIRRAGFDCVMLWWSDQFGRGPGYQADARLAVDAGLRIENIHAPVHEQNCLSMDSLAGESVYQSYLQCVRDCLTRRIPTLVIHLPGDDHPLTPLGLRRLNRIAREAEDGRVRIAFENLNNLRNLSLALSSFSSASVGFCYDSCHHMNYAPQDDLLEAYGDRLMALHLHDNGGERRQHQLPFDGSTDWPAVMRRISLTGYQGPTTLEPMNWDYTHLSIRQFLAMAAERAKRLDAMRLDAMRRE